MDTINDIEKENFNMPEIQIDEQFKSLLPVLDEQTYALLEESLLKNGCINPLVLWNGILIDGHNRYEICTKHEIPFETVEKEFASRDEALIWIISTQVARRNLTPIQLSYYRGMHYNADKRIVTNKTGINQHKEVEYQSGIQPQSQSTAARLAEQYNVSPMTINRDSQLARAVETIGESSPEAKREILSGTANISRQQLQILAKGASEEEIKAIAENIEQGTYERPKKGGDGSSEAMLQGILEALNAIIAKISKAYSTEMQQAENGGDDAAKLRTALRSHIKTLEKLYRSL